MAGERVHTGIPKSPGGLIFDLNSVHANSLVIVLHCKFFFNFGRTIIFRQ